MYRGSRLNNRRDMDIHKLHKKVIGYKEDFSTMLMLSANNAFLITEILNEVSLLRSQSDPYVMEKTDEIIIALGKIFFERVK